MRDALVAGLTLDTFNRHADKVAMANDAQLVNCIQALFFTDGARMITTPTYHVFDLYAAHQGGGAVRTEFAAPPVSWAGGQNPGRMGGLAGSASVTGRTLTLTVTNPHLTEPRETEITVRGGSAGAVRVTTLAAQRRARRQFVRASGRGRAAGGRGARRRLAAGVRVPAGVGDEARDSARRLGSRDAEAEQLPDAKLAVVTRCKHRNRTGLARSLIRPGPVLVPMTGNW